MPPIKKFDKEDIIKASLELIEKEGKDSFNSRKLASYLGCSVQPIFHNFTNMDELLGVVYDRVYSIFAKVMIDASLEENEPYKKTGLAYIKFAREHKEFFKMLFMQKTSLNSDDFMANGSPVDNIIKSGQKMTGLSYEEQRAFHKKVWIFTHGIACLVNTETAKLNDKEIEELLTSTVREMLIGNREDKR